MRSYGDQYVRGLQKWQADTGGFTRNSILLFVIIIEVEGGGAIVAFSLPHVANMQVNGIIVHGFYSGWESCEPFLINQVGAKQSHLGLHSR
jgi:hypothetical protein